MINHNPYGQMNPQLMQMPALNPTSNIQYVQGEAGAKGYPVTKGFTMLLMDSEEPKFYIKSADQSGMPTMKKFKFEEITDPPKENIEYVTKNDFKEFEDKILKLLQPKEQPHTKKAGVADA